MMARDSTATCERRRGRRDLLHGGAGAAAVFGVVGVGEGDVDGDVVVVNGDDAALDDDVRADPAFGFAVAVGEVHAHEGDVGGGDGVVDADGVAGSEAGGVGDAEGVVSGGDVDVGHGGGGERGRRRLRAVVVFVSGRGGSLADADAEVWSSCEHEDCFAGAGTAQHDVRRGDVDGCAEVESAGSEFECDGVAGFGGELRGVVELGLEGAGVVAAGGQQRGAGGDCGKCDASAHVAGVGEVGDVVAAIVFEIDEVAVGGGGRPIWSAGRRLLR